MKINIPDDVLRASLKFQYRAHDKLLKPKMEVKANTKKKPQDLLKPNCPNMVGSIKAGLLYTSLARLLQFPPFSFLIRCPKLWNYLLQKTGLLMFGLNGSILSSYILNLGPKDMSSLYGLFTFVYRNHVTLFAEEEYENSQVKLCFYAL